MRKTILGERDRETSKDYFWMPGVFCHDCAKLHMLGPGKLLGNFKSHLGGGLHRCVSVFFSLVGGDDG